MLYFSKGSFTMPFKMWGGICKLKLVLLLKKKKKSEEEVHLFKGHYKNVGNYHNENPLYY
jgi:hypothetical protein